MEDFQVRKASTTRIPILSLVEREHLKSIANIRRQSHEAISYLYSEHDGAIERARTAPATPDNPEWVRQAIIAKRLNAIRWLDEILLNSQSVDALRSWQLRDGIMGLNGGGQRPSASVSPDFNQPTPPGTEKPRRGMFRGREA